MYISDSGRATGFYTLTEDRLRPPSVNGNSSAFPAMGDPFRARPRWYKV